MPQQEHVAIRWVEPDQVEAHDLDAGIVLQAGFDEAVRNGSRPLLEFYVGGESLASNRLILAVTTLDAVRTVEGATPPVDVVIVSTGDPLLPMSSRMTPLLVLFALLTVFMAYQASHLKIDAGFAKLLPLEHEDLLVRRGAEPLAQGPRQRAADQAQPENRNVVNRLTHANELRLQNRAGIGAQDPKQTRLLFQGR